MPISLADRDALSSDLYGERMRELNALIQMLRFAERECATLSPTARRFIEQAVDELDGMKCVH